jgi:RHS repeat-associated protein
MEYNLRGRLSKITLTSHTDGQPSRLVTQEFTYDDSGIKVTQTKTVDEGADGSVDSEKTTEYLNDKLNHTGYSQVLEEKVTQDGQTTVTTYTIGHDVIAQFSAAIEALVLLADGHGSTRAVADAAAQIQQEYLYDAYGQLLNMEAGNALTSLLYSGEQFNPVAGLQYLRARWYDPSSGRFNRLDPFAGNVQDPLSLHKYAYVHGNPVMGVDPSGEFALLVAITLMRVADYLGTTFNFLEKGKILVSAAEQFVSSLQMLLFVRYNVDMDFGERMALSAVLADEMQTQAGIATSAMSSFVAEEVVTPALMMCCMATVITSAKWASRRGFRFRRLFGQSVLQSPMGGYIVFGKLDDVGRPTGIRARITRDILGKGSRASVSPAGWLGGQVADRAHLAAKGVGGPGGFAENITNLFAKPNRGAMAQFEKGIIAMVEEGSEAIYHVTPVYRGSSLFPHRIDLYAEVAGQVFRETIDNSV